MSKDVTSTSIESSRLDALEARLEAVTNANRILLETLSHDLRTPLNSIIGFADMMDQEILGTLENKTYRSYIHDICGSGRQMLEILHDVLERQRFEQMEKSETDFRHMFELAPDLISVCRGGAILRMNPAGASLLGLWPADVLIGRQFAEFVHDDYKPLVADGLDQLTDRTARLPMKLCRADGGVTDVELAAVPYVDDENEGDTAGDTVLLIARDVTERNRAIQSVAASEAHVRNIMDTVVEGIITVDQRGAIETINPAAEAIFGYRPGDLKDGHIAQLIADDPETGGTGAIPPAFMDCLDNPHEVEGRRQDGTVVPIEMTVSTMANRGTRTYIAALHDITERKMVEARLVELATRDPLTKLPNRTAFTEKLNQELASVTDGDEMSAVLFVDIDNFRHINETRGHIVADEVIRMVGERLERCIRPCDTVAHFGGDEFMVLLSGISGDEEPQAMGQQILDILGTPFTVDDRELVVTASIGAVLYPVHGDSVGELLKNADTALHHGKSRQRGGLTFYAAEQSENIDRWVELETGLRQALAQDAFNLNFQPKVELLTGKMVGAEALIRWHSPTLGSVSPVEFVPVAEETGLVGPIGDWVLWEACRQAAHWNRISGTPLHVGVNIAAHQIQRGDLGQKVKLCLEETGLDPELLELELTESAMFDTTGGMNADLNDLRERGVTIAIDDFGTGYSSLSYLTSFPLDTLKVDRAFVMNLPDDRDAVAIARAIIGMANSLELHIVAEGIETGSQETFLQALGCHTGQGYKFSKPLDEAAFLALLGDTDVVPLKASG